MLFRSSSCPKGGNKTGSRGRSQKRAGGKKISTLEAVTVPRKKAAAAKSTKGNAKPEAAKRTAKKRKAAAASASPDGKKVSSRVQHTKAEGLAVSKVARKRAITETETSTAERKTFELRAKPNSSENDTDWEAKLHKDALNFLENSDSSYGSEVAGEVRDLLKSRLKYEGTGGMTSGVFFLSEMKKYGCFYASYLGTVVAAMIAVREGLSYGRRDAMIIKHFAVKKGYDGYDFGHFLLHKFAQNVLKHVDVDVFAYVVAGNIMEFCHMSSSNFSRPDLTPSEDHVLKLKQRTNVTGFFKCCGFSLDKPRPENNFRFSEKALVPPVTFVMQAASSYLQSHLSTSSAPLKTTFFDLNPYMFDSMWYV